MPASFQCADCGRALNSQAALQRHQRIHSAEASSAARPAHVCHLCDLSCQNLEDLIAHLGTHRPRTPPRPRGAHRCGHCPKSFGSAFGLRRHVRASHAARQHYTCPRCRFNPTSLALLHEHYKRCHASERLCDRCGESFRTAQKFWRHTPACRQRAVPTFECVFCREAFPDARTRLIHQKTCYRRACHVALLQERDAAACGFAPPAEQGCQGGGAAPRVEEGEAMVQATPPPAPAPAWTSTFALQGAAEVHTLPVMNQTDLNAALIDSKQALVAKLASMLETSRSGIKFWIVARTTVSKEEPGAEDEGVVIREEEKALRSSAQVLHMVPENIVPQLEAAFLEILQNAESLFMEGSNWVISGIHALEVCAGRFQPLRGGGSFLPLPDWLKPKRSLTNIQNTGSDDCFRLSVIAGLRDDLGRRNRTRPQHYAPHVDELEMGDLEYEPFRVADVPKFEELNPTISLTILALVIDEDEPEDAQPNPVLAAVAARRLQAEGFPIASDGSGDEGEGEEEEEELGEVVGEEDGLERGAGGAAPDEALGLDGDVPSKVKQPKNHHIIVKYSPREKKQNHITLLLLEDRERGKSHFVLVNKFHAFLASLRKSRRSIFFCCYCLGPIYKQAKLEEHEKICRDFGAQKVDYPRGLASFDRPQWKKQQRCAFSVYYDFECALKKLADEERPYRTQEHVPVAFSLIAIDWEGNFVEEVVKHGPEEDDITGQFLSELLRLEERLWQRRTHHPLRMSAAQQRLFDSTTHCQLCGDRFEEEGQPGARRAKAKVADHDHLVAADNLRYVCCSSCNSAMQMQSFLAVIGHNANRYDLHCIFRGIIAHDELRRKATQIEILPKTVDTYRSATIYLRNGRQLKFLDSFQFVASSLDEISKSLEEADLETLKAVYPAEDQRVLLQRKGVFCYEFVESYRSLTETRALPSREQFYSSLSGGLPSEADYARAVEVWEGLGCQSLLDYCIHYLRTDVILLSAFMTKYRKMIFSKYGLEVNHFVSSSSLSLQCMFKFTKAQVQRISDPTKHAMFTVGAKGGYSAIHKRYSEANVPGTPDYDPTKPQKHIMMFDINAVSFPLSFVFFFFFVCISAALFFFLNYLSVFLSYGFLFMPCRCTA